MNSNSMKNIVLYTTDGWIVLDWKIKTRGWWIAGADFIHKNFCKKAYAIHKKTSMASFLLKG